MTPTHHRVARGCVAAVLVGFFLPWARLEVREPSLLRQLSDGMRRSLDRSATGAKRANPRLTPKTKGLATIPTHVSGFQVPLLANGEQAKVATQLVELFTQDSQHVGPKSYAVYLVPGLALALGGMLVRFGSRRVIAAAIGVVALAVAAAGGWQVWTIDTKPMVHLSIASGLWICLGAYAGLGAVALHAARPTPRPLRHRDA